jgi:hypothetical protein
MRTRWTLTSCKASFMRTRAAADAEIHGIGMAVPLAQNGETWRHATDGPVEATRNLDLNSDDG